MVYDVLVIGSGIAGLCAAIEACEKGLKCAVITKSNPLRSNSSMAAGGINASLAVMEQDSVEEHIADTIRGADGLANKSAVKKLCENAKEAIDFLSSCGVAFDKQENGLLIQRSFGGAGKKRTCYIADKTGGAIVQALFKKARALKAEFLADRILLSLLATEGKIGGITVYNKNGGIVEILGAKSVVLAGGGFAGIYRGHSSNPLETSGDILAAAMSAGLRLADMEFVQFHPTGLAKSGSLVSEAARGEGGKLLNSDGERFIDELSTRDVISRAIARQMEDGKGVFIDVRHLGEEAINAKLPSFRKAAIGSEGVDPLTALVPIKPVAHYTMGGIEANEDCKTAIKGLFACGECAAIGIHGANRLGGNSLLDAAVFGRAAGVGASSFAVDHEFSNIDLRQAAKDVKMIDYLFGHENRYNVQALKKSLGETLYKKAGVFRNEEDLISAYEYVGYLKTLAASLHTIEKTRPGNFEIQSILEFKNSLFVAEAVTLSALARKESRGAHFRTDYPQKSAEYEKRAFVRASGGAFRVELEGEGALGGALKKLKNLLKGN